MANEKSKDAILSEFLGANTSKGLERFGIKRVRDLSLALAKLGNFGLCGGGLKAKVLTPLFDAGFSVRHFVNEENEHFDDICRVFEIPISKIIKNREVLKVLAQGRLSRVIDIANMTNNFVLTNFKNQPVSEFEILSEIKSSLNSVGVVFDEGKWGFAFDGSKLKSAPKFDNLDVLVLELGLGARFETMLAQNDILTARELAIKKQEICEFFEGKSRSNVFSTIKNKLENLGVWETTDGLCK